MGAPLPTPPDPPPQLLYYDNPFVERICLRRAALR
jgi:hypothetical protein